jgi:hypothetical protein
MGWPIGGAPCLPGVLEITEVAEATENTTHRPERILESFQLSSAAPVEAACPCALAGVSQRLAARASDERAL